MAYILTSRKEYHYNKIILPLHFYVYSVQFVD